MARILGRLSVFSIILTLSMMFSSAVYAQTCAEESAAIAACQAHAPQGWTCRAQPDTVYPRWDVEFWDGSRSGGDYANGVCASTPPPPTNPCDSVGTNTYNAPGNYSNGSTQCNRVRDPSSGAIVMCEVSITPLGPPVAAPGGGFHTQITTSASGSTCDGSRGDGGVQDASGAPVPTAKAPPAVPPDPIPAAPPKACGGDSCYDPGNNQFCATSGGEQTCVPAPAPGDTSGGGCSSGATATICAGTPDAPKPPANVIPDPATQASGHDNYQQANPSTGAIGNVGVGTYSGGVGGSKPVTSGQTSSDTGPAKPSSSGAPASSSSSAKDNTSASGGGDCSNPPHVEGSPALGMVALQAWDTRCAIVKASTCTGASCDDAGIPGVDGIPNAPGTGEGVQDGGNFLDRLDYSGLVGGGVTCPVPLDLDLPDVGVSYHTTPEHWCDLLDGVAMVLMMYAVYKAITVLGSK